VIKPTQARAEARHIESHQQPSRESGESEIGQHLGGMNGMQRLHRLQFHDHVAIDQQIELQSFPHGCPL